MIEKTIQKSLAELPSFKRVVVGVSGGPDSVALVHILKSMGYEIVIAHLNHQLRGKDSDLDAEFVDKLSKKWKVPCVSHRVQLPKRGNTENHARNARYGFLEKVRQTAKADFIAVAHHQDDQIETVLMHMLRGAGLKGMGGMQLHYEKIIRPFLHVSKSDLLDYLKKNKLSYRIDRSNADISYERNRLRHRVIPALRKECKTFDQDLLKMAEAAQKEWKEMQEKADNWIEDNVVNQQFSCDAFLALPDALQSEIIFNLSGYLNVNRLQIRDAKELIKKGVTNKRKKVGRITFELIYDQVHFYKTAFKITKFKRKKLGPKEISWGLWKIKNKSKELLFVRSWKPGDRFQPNGMNGTKKLQDFFVDQKISKIVRHQVPIIVNQKDEILSVGNFRLAKEAVYLKKCLQVTKNK